MMLSKIVNGNLIMANHLMVVGYIINTTSTCHVQISHESIIDKNSSVVLGRIHKHRFAHGQKSDE